MVYKKQLRTGHKNFSFDSTPIIATNRKLQLESKIKIVLIIK